jgi:hypothetical protein
MAGWRLPGPTCQVANWLNVVDGTQAITPTPPPGTVTAPVETPDHLLAGVTGKIDGVGLDIVAYLKAVGEFFGVNILVTSGKRDADTQAQAMFDNWIKLKRGAVYSTLALSLKNRQSMDAYYKIAVESDKSEADKDIAKRKFMEIGRTVRSRHMGGRAVDILLSSITKEVQRALLMRLKEVKEGNRTDIIHVESTSPVPAVDAKMEARWQALLDRAQTRRDRHAMVESDACDHCVA